MDIVMNVLRVTLEEGLMYALLAIGVYITYSILDFPDLSVDGTMPMGAIVTAVLIIHGMNPWLCLVITFLLGMACGAITGLLHVKLNIRPLLCGIIVYTAMLSINLVILFKGNNGITVANFCLKKFNNFTARSISYIERQKTTILEVDRHEICDYRSFSIKQFPYPGHGLCQVASGRQNHESLYAASSKRSRHTGRAGKTREEEAGASKKSSKAGGSNSWRRGD